jgi:PiT family inorganic phosphate transporter
MDLSLLLILGGALAIALAFEACNGFHDTANAVATVIYTKSLHPQVAVIWSGLMNFLGVLLGGIAVAFSIVHLLPVDLLVRIDSGAGLSMVFALLLSAMIWNLGTWYYGIPSSSSHALIGSILGVGLANSMLAGNLGGGVNWSKAGQVGLSLLISPIIGFVMAALLLLLMIRFLRDPKLHSPPEGNTPPPWHIRGVLILTCTGVSFAHGSNDGQKGIGLIMLILIGLVPAHYALNPDQSPEKFRHVVEAPAKIQSVLKDPEVVKILAATRPNIPLVLAVGPVEDSPREAASDLPPAYRMPDPDLQKTEELLAGLNSDLEGKKTPSDLSPRERWQVRTKTVLLDQSLGSLQKRLGDRLIEDKAKILASARGDLREAIEYAPTWVIGAVALALGVGTMIGWKRIVVTVGEKIGKEHLTYSQGAAAELVAMSTIGMADMLGMPVSTTHVLSSGVAGTMAANKTGLQLSTVRSIALAWILTLPVCVTLAGGLFLLFRLFV